MLRFECPECGKRLKVPEADSAKRMLCPGCNAPIVIDSIVGQNDRTFRDSAIRTTIPGVGPIESPARQGLSGSREQGLPTFCPFCAEEVKPGAIKCKHCGEAIDRSQW